jgi:hypothetical protein
MIRAALRRIVCAAEARIVSCLTLAKIGADHRGPCKPLPRALQAPRIQRDTPPHPKDTPPRAPCGRLRVGRGARDPRRAAGAGRGQDGPVDARIVWTRADRAYVAAADSLMIAPGDILFVMKGKKTVATCVVLQTLARDLAAARITSGSLEHAKLDRLRILAERPPLPALPLLRIGYPGRGRASLLFACERPAPRPPLAEDTYRVDSLAENVHRLVRAASTAPWPDTIMIALFADASDEEIALERGELDLAVFWPGEASSRLRADSRWQGFAYGAKGVVWEARPRASRSRRSIRPSSPSTMKCSAATSPPGRLPARSRPASEAMAGPRFVVDPSCPGHLTLEHFLERHTTASAQTGDRVALVIAARSDSLGPRRCLPCAARRLEPRAAPLRCGPGADAIVDMLTCSAASRTP